MKIVKERLKIEDALDLYFGSMYESDSDKS